MATDVSVLKYKYKCLILNPLCEDRWGPLICKLAEKMFISNVISYRCFKLVYLQVCHLNYLCFYYIMYQIKWNCVSGQHAIKDVLLDVIALYKYIWSENIKWHFPELLYHFVRAFNLLDDVFRIGDEITLTLNNNECKIIGIDKMWVKELNRHLFVSKEMCDI